MLGRFAARVGCLFGQHSSRRRSVWHDNIDLRSRCRGCGRPLRQDLHGRWHLFDNARDASPHRQPHPRYDR